MNPEETRKFHQLSASFLEKQMPQYLGYLEAMVGTNSFSSYAEGVNRVAEQTSEIFANLGFESKRIRSGNLLHGDHLLLTKAGSPDLPQRPIVMISHLDTVYPEEEEIQNNFHWRREGNRIYGPGTIDIKGGTVLIYMVLDALKHSDPDLFHTASWSVILNAAEENLPSEFRQVYLDNVPEGALACLVFEGGRWSGNALALVTARKGRAAFRVKVKGRAAHAGVAHKNGANAVVQMAETVTRIAQLTDYEKDVTFNVGNVGGGTVINRVPHSASASGEIRAFTPSDLDHSVEELIALQNEISVKSSADDYACQVEIEIIDKWQPWPPNQESQKLYAVWQQTARELGLETVEERRGGLSDGNNLWDLAPTLDGLGPSGGNAHCSERTEDGKKDQEFVRLSSFVPKAALNAAAIRRLLYTAEMV